MPNVLPTPTDAVMKAPLGLVPQPVNPAMVCTLDEANAVVKDMIDTGCITAGTQVNISDQPWLLGPVIYGRDERRVLVIEWDEGETHFSVWAGFLVWWKACMPDNTLYKWRKDSYGGITRN